jgi:hypothetical protein
MNGTPGRLGANQQQLDQEDQRGRDDRERHGEDHDVAPAVVARDKELGAVGEDPEEGLGYGETPENS